MKRFLQILHPIKTTLEFRLHITDAFGVGLSHSHDALFIRRQSVDILLLRDRVLLLGDLYRTKKVSHGVAHHGSSIRIERHERDRFRPNDIDTITDV